MNYKKNKGKHAEEFVAHYLQDQGFALIAQNYRLFFGEIDLIATKKNLIIFVEVKVRTTHQTDLAELIILSKQRKISTVAREFLSSHPEHYEKVCRFDVALINGHTDYVLHYIENAFYAE